MKIAAHTIAFREAEFIRASIDSVYPHVSRYLVQINDRPFSGDEEKYPPDETDAILAEMEASGRYPNLIVVRGFWGSDEPSCRNWGLDYLRMECPDITHCWINDSDEGWTEEGARNLVEFVTNYSQTHTVFYAKCRTYWKNFGYWIEPMEPRCPLVIHDIVSVTRGNDLVSPYYDSIRNLSKGAKIIVPESVAVQQHFSYVRANDDRIREKIETSPHAREFDPTWFERVWKAWTPDMTDLHPCAGLGGCYRKAVPSDPASLPESFRGLTAFMEKAPC